MNIKTIAEMCGVSVATISRVINNSGKVKDETRDKVIKAIEELDYVPNALARSLSRKESDVIGVVVPDISNSFYIELIKGVMEEANNNGLSIVFFNSDKSLEKELKAMKMLREQRIKGMLLISAVKKDEVDILRRNIKNMNIPLVLINKYIENLNYDGVFTDDIMASLSRQADEAGLEVCLISSDLDMLQCLTPNVHMYALKKGFSQIELYKPEYFEEKYGMPVGNRRQSASPLMNKPSTDFFD